MHDDGRGEGRVACASTLPNPNQPSSAENHGPAPTEPEVRGSNPVGRAHKHLGYGSFLLPGRYRGICLRICLRRDGAMPERIRLTRRGLDRARDDRRMNSENDDKQSPACDPYAIAVSQSWWAMSAVLRFAADARATHGRAADLRAADLRPSARVAALTRPPTSSSRGHPWSWSHRRPRHRSVYRRRSTVQRVSSRRAALRNSPCRRRGAGVVVDVLEAAGGVVGVVVGRHGAGLGGRGVARGHGAVRARRTGEPSSQALRPICHRRYLTDFSLRSPVPALAVYVSSSSGRLGTGRPT
jgi:hypothetical protein